MAYPQLPTLKRPSARQVRNSLAELLERRQIGGAELARRAGVPYESLRRVVREGRDLPLAHGLRLAAVLDADLEALFSIDGDPEPRGGGSVEHAASRGARPAPLRYAVLALLRDGVTSADGVERRLRALLDPLSGVSRAQVRRALRSIERQGLAAPEGDREWRITASGRRALDRWLEALPVRATRFRDELVIKLLGLGMSGGASLDLVRRERELHRSLAESLRRERSRLDGRGGGGVLEQLAAQGALLHIDAHVCWLDLCAEVLGGAIVPADPAQPARAGDTGAE